MSANDTQVGGSHYRSGLQHWDLIERYGIGYLEAAATKYVVRWRKKNGVEDLKKSRHYTVKLLELYDEGVRLPRGIVPFAIAQKFFKENELGVLESQIVFELTRWTGREDLLAAIHAIDQLIRSEEDGPQT